MSRAGYSDDVDDNWDLICWRGAVTSAIRGKRGQAFLRELLAALDALPEKRLIADELEEDGCFCALGAVGKARGLDLSSINTENWRQMADTFGIAEAMAREIMAENDNDFAHRVETPEQRFRRVRAWVERHLIEWEAA